MVALRRICLALVSGMLLTGSVLPASLLLPALPAIAAPQTVTSSADAGAGSLRDAIANASANDTISFAPNLTGGQKITLTSGELAIGKSLTIQNASGQVVTVSGNNASRVFHITAGTVTLRSLTIQDGLITSTTTTVTGGGILVEAGASLTLDQDVVQNKHGARCEWHQ